MIKHEWPDLHCCLELQAFRIEVRLAISLGHCSAALPKTVSRLYSVPGLYRKAEYMFDANGIQAPYSAALREFA
jgi:hypothetical protein